LAEAEKTAITTQLKNVPNKSHVARRMVQFASQTSRFSDTIENFDDL
jgi:hypothetical protein